MLLSFDKFLLLLKYNDNPCELAFAAACHIYSVCAPVLFGLWHPCHTSCARVWNGGCAEAYEGDCAPGT